VLHPPDRHPVTISGSGSVDRILESLTEHGIAMLAGVNDRAALLRIGRAVMRIRTHRDSDADGVTSIEHRITHAAAGSLVGFTDRDLSPHTDGTAVAAPPRLLMLTCLRRPRIGGSVILVDGRAVYNEIADTDPDMLDALRAPHCAFFGGASGHLGSVFTETPDGRMTVRLHFDDLIRYSPAAALYQQRLRAIVRQHERAIDLTIGNGYIVRNDRWLHGRNKFEGARLMLRLIGDPTPRTGPHRISPGELTGRLARGSRADTMNAESVLTVGPELEPPCARQWQSTIPCSHNPDNSHTCTRASADHRTHMCDCGGTEYPPLGPATDRSPNWPLAGPSRQVVQP
jgi:Taurine catabolism dioxygenase TauD, TfdA family